MSDNRFTLSDEAGATVLQFNDVVIVGRSPSTEHLGVTYDQALKLEQTTVSSNHASLAPAREGLLVTDLDSTNGTFINHQRLIVPTVAVSGDEIRFDTHTLVLADEQAPESMPADSAQTDLSATVVRPGPGADDIAAVPDDSDLAGAAMGQTMIMAINKNLPRSWQNDSPGTIILKPEEVNDQFAIDADELAAQFDEPTLVLLGDSGEGQPISLRSEGDINFWNIGKNGAKHELSILLEDPSVSDFHAKLVRRGDKWSVHDQMSTNKTRVNGDVVLKRFLSSKDVIEFGGTKAILLLPEPNTVGSVDQTESGTGTAAGPAGSWRWLLVACALAIAAIALFVV